MLETTLRSDALDNERSIWVQRGAAAEVLLVVLDGEYYRDQIEAPAIVNRLVEAGEVPPLRVAYVSHIDDTHGRERWSDSFCNEQFARFVVEELIPYVSEGQTFDHVFIGGLSLTGLAATHAAFCYPERFAGVLAQSPSLWWSDDWLTNQFRQRGRIPVRFRITAGNLETAEQVQHTPELFQRTSNLECARMMRDVLTEQGTPISYQEFEGGHDFPSWKNDLPRSLTALLSE